MRPLPQWSEIPAQLNVCALSYAGDYVISHRPFLFTCSYRPTGRHVHIAQCETLDAAKQAAQTHFDALRP